MPSLYDNAGLRQATSGILHYLHTKMCGIPEDCLVEVWAMAHPQIEGLERASELIIPAASGYANSALQGEVLDVETFTHEDGYRFSRIFASDSASPKLLFTQDNLHCVHTTQAYTYIFTVEEDHFYRIPRSTSLSRDLHDEERFSLRPWSAGDGQSSGVFWATSCDASFVYGMPLDGIIEIDVEDDIGRYRTIQSGDLGDVSATILNGKATLFWLHGQMHPLPRSFRRRVRIAHSEQRCWLAEDPLVA
ncbi:hypothetical protein FOZ60_012784 [Perkinsus olseni]|uniref:Uncharacterized protein n=3 Tax=Perkinsus olseni TaxID=32597 RepID=A0A7J6NAL2_PEROL|nr:hypothetical protein FOZ60_012784 [Perkinsus olseni]